MPRCRTVPCKEFGKKFFREIAACADCHQIVTSNRPKLPNLTLLTSVEYKAAESESASMLLISTLALAVTVPAMLWISR